MNLQIKDYFDFIAIKSGRFRPEVSKTNVQIAVNEVCNHYMRIATLKGIRI